MVRNGEEIEKILPITGRYVWEFGNQRCDRLESTLIYDGPDSKRIILAQTALNMYSSRRWMTEFALECRENRLSAKKGKVLMQL